MSNKNLSERVANIECAIENCNNTLRAIVVAGNVKFGEQLKGVSREAWDQQGELRRQLKQCLIFAEQHITAAELFLP